MECRNDGAIMFEVRSARHLKILSERDRCFEGLMGYALSNPRNQQFSDISCDDPELSGLCILSSPAQQQ
jgi:hypothetical protein